MNQQRSLTSAGNVTVASMTFVSKCACVVSFILARTMENTSVVGSCLTSTFFELLCETLDTRLCMKTETLTLFVFEHRLAVITLSGWWKSTSAGRLRPDRKSNSLVGVRGHTSQGRRHKMVQIAAPWSRKLQCVEAHVIQRSILRQHASLTALMSCSCVVVNEPLRGEPQRWRPQLGQ